MALTPVILCGGSGTRLFPLSRASRPKQLLQLMGEKSLIQQTVERVRDPLLFTPPIIVCNADYRFAVAEQLREIGVTPQAIVLEPEGRNTAPAVAVAAELALAAGADGRLLVLASDHAIADVAGFLKAVATADLLSRTGDSLVTFGIKPDRPETGYGYIELGEAIGGDSFRIASFSEKPDLETAKAFLADARHLWNSGMFLFSASRILNELERFEPDLLSLVRESMGRATHDLDFLRLDPAAFARLKPISIDKAVMERVDGAAVVPVDIGWNDIGSWDALWQISEQDGEGNVAVGDVVAEDSHGCYIRAEQGLVAAIGARDLIIVATPDVVMVAPRSRAQDVGKLVERLKREKRAETQVARRMHRPWGWYEGVATGTRFQVKQILVKPGQRLSLQKHYHRAEHWIVVQGTALVTVDNENTLIKENESAYIPLGAVHRLENPGHIPLLLIEVQSGSYLGEDDIVRLADDFRRDKEGQQQHAG